MKNNYSSSEDFTESQNQNFNDFMNAKNSDDEDEALFTRGEKKSASTGFYDTKGAGKGYPYGAPSYGNPKSQSGYGTYGTYGGGGDTYGSGYGSGYGGSGFGGSGNKQAASYGSGYGGYGGTGGGSGYGSGYGAGSGTGYGGGGYGTGYGNGGAYSGYDITGFGGTGYEGAGAGTGYQHDEDDEEDENGGLDLKSVMERKAAQKAAKEAEQKKLEEEKAKKLKMAQASSLKNTGLKSGGDKKDKKGRLVSFNLGDAIQDDSENENDKTISHISEKSNSESSGDARKPHQSKEKNSKTSNKILNMSDDEKDSEYSDRKKRTTESDEENKQNNKPSQSYNATSSAKKEEKVAELESSYPDDFEESSSKFGSADFGKSNLKNIKSVEKKQEDFEESSNYLSESKETKGEEKLDYYGIKKTAGQDQVKEKVAENNNETNKPNILVNRGYEQPISSLTQNYQTGIAKDYVYESLLKDERRRVEKLETQLTLGGDQIKTVQQLIQEKDVTIHKLESQIQNLQKEMTETTTEAQEISKRNKIFEVENEDLQKRVEVLENKVLEIESQKKLLVRDNEEKAKMLKERREYLEKNFETKAINEIKAQYEKDKDLLLIRIEELQEENKHYLEDMEKLREESRLYKTSFRGKAESDQEIKKLKQEIMLLELKLKDKDQSRLKKKPEVLEHEKTVHDVSSGIPELDKEIQMQDLLIKGFQKENEKLMVENKTLKRDIEELNARLYDENKKVTEMKVKLVNNTDSVLITDKEIDIETRKILGSENLISKNDLKVAQAKILQLHHELQAREDAFKQRELELKYEIDRLRSQKMELEGRLGGVDLASLKKQDEDYKTLLVSIEEERKGYEMEIKDLKSKLSWYIENQESIMAKEEIIKQKDENIRKLEEEISKILSDPSTNLDSKSKYYNRITNEDKKRIKQLERDIESLEEALKKRNPGVYDKIKSQQDESKIVQELKQTVKKLQDDKALLESEYEIKLNDLRQKFDKMRIRYENKGNEVADSKPGKNPNINDNHETTEVLKARIKELEKEVEDAKKYYLKKAQQLKDNKKGGKALDKATVNSKDTKPSTRKPAQIDIKSEKDSQFSDDKENIKDAFNSRIEEEKANLMDKLIDMHLTPAYSILNAFFIYKQSILDSLRTDDNSAVTSSSREFIRNINDILSGFLQKDDIFQKVRRIEEIRLTENNDPRPLLGSIQKTLYDLIWAETQKDKSALMVNVGKQNAKLNNYFDVDQPTENGNRRLIVLEENLKKKEEEMAIIQQKLAQITLENARLTKDKSNLELIMQQLPKNPKSLDFATMEKRLEIMERNSKENELELKNAFRKAYNMDPFQTTSDAELNKIKATHEKEIGQLKNLLERKNQEIIVFRQEMEVILKELNKLRRNKM